MSLDQRHSGWLDGELETAEAAAVEAELAADPALAAEVEVLRSVRALLRERAMIDLHSDASDRLIARIEALDAAGQAVPWAPVVDVATRHRRLRRFAAAAAAFAIIVSVIGGVGGDTTLPAIGDLVVRHNAAAAEMPNEPMGESMSGMPKMAGEVDMMAATVADGMAHAVYVAKDGSIVSVFRLDGELDSETLVDDMGGSIGEMDGHDMWAKDIGTRHVVVLDGEGYVWTIISDVEVDPVADLVNELPERSPSFAQRMRAAAGAVIEPFGLGS